jgi:5-methylcytosine-specific restriction endonuclease McrA
MPFGMPSLPLPTQEVLRLWAGTEELLEVLSRLSGRSVEELESELREHLAVRISFLLLGEARGASNYFVLEKRVRDRLTLEGTEVKRLAGALALSASQVDAWNEEPRTALTELPYPVRQRMLRRQGARCAICGFRFGKENTGRRSTLESMPTLDHRVPYRVGGNAERNLWILCGLCNRIKEAAVHVGEHGRVWSNNFVYFSRSRVVAFWTFVRDKGCRSTGCEKGPGSSRMFCRRRSLKCEVVVDNCMTLCEEHQKLDDIVDY